MHLLLAYSSVCLPPHADLQVKDLLACGGVDLDTIPPTQNRTYREQGVVIHLPVEYSNTKRYAASGGVWPGQ